MLGQDLKDESVEVASNRFREVSFSNNLTNWLRKSNDTVWVKVENNLYWYSATPTVLLVNNHHADDLI